MSPLAKQQLPISFGGGLDTKTDPSSVPLGKWLVLENCVFTKPGSLHKRNGYAALSQTRRDGGGSISAAQGLAAYDKELLLFDAGNLWSLDVRTGTGIERWLTRNPYVPCTVTRTAIVRNSYQQTSQDGGVYTGGVGGDLVECYAWEDTQGGVRFSLLDLTTGALVNSGVIISTAIKPKVVICNGFAFILYVDTADWRIKIFDPLNGTPGVGGANVTAASGNSQLKSTAPNYDAQVVTTGSGTRVYIAYNDSTPTTGGTSAVWADVSAMVWSSATQLAAEPSNVVNVFADTFSQNPVVAYYNGTAVKYAARSADLSTSLSAGTIETVANVVLIAGVNQSASARAWQVFYSTSAAATYNYLTRLNTVTGSYAVGTAGVYLRSVALAGKAFSYNATAFVPVTYESLLQPTYFIADQSGNLVAKVLPQVGGGIPKRISNGAAMLPETFARTSTSFGIALLEKTNLNIQTGSQFGSYMQAGVSSVTLNFYDTKNSYLRVAAADTLHLSGGFFAMYDGGPLVEHGFHLFPEGVSLAAVGSGGTLGAGSYGVMVCYEWADNKGQIHRSAPSVSQSVTVVANGSITVTIPTLRLTAKQARSPVTCVVYRTLVNGTLYYRDTSATVAQNSMVTDTVTFTCSQSDAGISANNTVYTTGGVVENIAPGPCTSPCLADNRVWFLDALTGTLGFSKQVVPGAPVEFSDLLVFNLDQRYGPASALGTLDDKKIVFRPTAISFVVGQGPDSTGAQNDLTEYQITGDVGCQNPRSIVRMPDGLMFQSAKGIYLLDRSLNVSYIGAPVEAYNAGNVTSAVLIDSANQVRMTLDSGVALVFDYYMRQWSVFTNIAAVDATTWQGVYCFATSGGLVVQETPGTFADPSVTFIKMRAVSSWIQMAGVQGFQRVRELLFLEDYKSAHTLTIKLSYDFSATVAQTNTFTVTSDADPEQFRVALAKQKCQALQISVEDGQSGSPGESCVLSALSLEFGLKGRLQPVPAAQSAG